MPIPANEKQAYLNRQWEDNKYFIRVFSLILLIHTVYIILVDYVFFPGTGTLLVTLIVFIIYVPVTIGVVALSFLNPLRHAAIRYLWYTLLSIASIMLAFGIILKTLLCYYGVENQASCAPSNRPIASAEYSVIYLTLGPILFLIFMKNNIYFQAVASTLILLLVIFTIIVLGNVNLISIFSIIFFVGAQALWIAAAWNSERVSERWFLADRQLSTLNQSLGQEIEEKNRAQERAAAEEQKRMQFTSVLFHEMRVPLNAVLLSFNDLDSDERFKHSISKEANENLERISSGLNSIINILNDSLDLRKIEEGRFTLTIKPFVYHDMVRSVVFSMEAGVKEKQIELSLDFDPRISNLDVKLLGDETRLRQVIANYLSNAIKFSPPKSHITIKTFMEEVTGKNVTIYTHVEDIGVGISEENQLKLFKPFVQLENSKYTTTKGSGLGLSIVASIIKSMEGTFGVRSTLGKGSTFWFQVTLDLSDVPVHVPGATVIPSGASGTSVDSSLLKTIHVLVTDDDNNTRRILQKIIENAGFTCGTAFDGVDCLEKLEKEHYDILILDNQMPRMDGKDVIIYLRNRGNKIPIVSLTGSSDMPALAEIRAAGASEILLKPVKKEDLISTISNLVTELDIIGKSPGVT